VTGSPFVMALDADRCDSVLGVLGAVAAVRRQLELRQLRGSGYWPNRLGPTRSVSSIGETGAGPGPNWLTSRLPGDIKV
jgi:hypothetical protein